MSEFMNKHHFGVLMAQAVADDDAMLHQLLKLQTLHPKNWEEFLVDVILAQSVVNKSLRDQLVDVMSQLPPKPIYVSTETGKFVPDGAWSDDYPEDDTPSGAWHR